MGKIIVDPSLGKNMLGKIFHKHKFMYWHQAPTIPDPGKVAGFS